MDPSNPYAPPSMPSFPAEDDISRQLQGLQYPLTLSFKILALASQATVTDAPGWGVEINPAWLDKAQYRVSEV